MPLTPNTKLGPYEITSLIGAGGMGEVYRARDTKLGRDVAIKVLPAAFSADVDRLRRFEQEAQAAGSLNHPNVLVIYHVDTHEGAPYIVSELLEGETLRERMNGKSLPQRKAIDYALQTAHGLAAAHEKGIVHRDLKPENLFVTKDGRVKILDFGLAKLTGAADGTQSQTEVPTRRIDTDPGVVMGTLGYMSPEQLRGRVADHRSDIFSFGAIFYEMLSGNRAFHGESTADTMSAVLREDPPDLSATNKTIAPALERVVNHCLEKNPEERFHSASDLAFAIEALSGTQGSGATTISTVAASEPSWLGQRRKLFDRIGWIAAALFLVSTLALAALYFRSAEPRPQTMRFSLPVPEKATFGEAHALAPDGSRLVFVATGAGGVTSLWVRALNDTAARELPGTEGGSFPFWSPDSRFIAFFADNKLKKIDASGGPAQSLADASADARGGAWGTDGTIVFTPAFTTPLYKVSSGGGAAPTQVTQFDESRNQTSHRWPSFLPDGRRFLYFSRSTDKESEGIYVGSLDKNESKFLLNTSQLATYAPPAAKGAMGHLLFIREKTLVAQPFDPARLQLSGEPQVLEENVLNFPGEGGPTAYAAFSVSSNGHLSFQIGQKTMNQTGWFDRAGDSLASMAPPADSHEPALSPDGKRVVIGRRDTQSEDLWMLDAGSGTMTRFTFDQAADVCPLWSPDGSHIIFSSTRSGKFALYRKVSSGAGSDEVLLQTETNSFADDWLRMEDGREFLLYESEEHLHRFGLHILPLFGDRKPYPFLDSNFNETHGQFSPDGRWVAYVSDESGRAEVYVQSFPVSGGKWQVSAAGGDQPQWRGDGRELFYMAPDKKLMAVPVTPGASFEAGAPVALFATRVPWTSLTDDRNSYLPSADGRRFFVINLVEEGNTQPITLVLNWANALKQ